MGEGGDQTLGLYAVVFTQRHRKTTVLPHRPHHRLALEILANQVKEMSLDGEQDR